MSLPRLYVITGASQGLGAAIAAQLLARADAHVLAIARKRNVELDTLAGSSGARLTQWQLDLLDAEPAVQRLSEWLAEQSGQRWSEACLINNAALLPERIAPLSETSAQDMHDVLRLNLLVPMLLVSQFLRSTEHWQGARKVLNISSGLGRLVMASMAPYSAAKAGVDQFTQCLAKEESRKPHGARVCSLAPGVVDTEMQRKMRETDALDFPDAKSFRFLHSVGRLLAVTEAAELTLELLDSENFGSETLAELRQGSRAGLSARVAP